MKINYRTLAIAICMSAATAAFAQTTTTAAGSGNTTRRNGDIFHYGPLQTSPNQALSNPLNGGGNSLGRTKPTGQAAVTPVPEPSQWAMMIAGLALVGVIVRRSSKRS